MAKIVQINAIVFGYFMRQIAEQRNVNFSNAALQTYYEFNSMLLDLVDCREPLFLVYWSMPNG